MALKSSTLAKHFSALQKIEEHRTAQSERNIRRIYKALLQDLREFIGVEYATLAEDDKLTYEILQRKGQYARFLEEFERRINNITPEASTEIKQLVENMYDISYKGMVGAVEKNKNLKELKEKLGDIKNVTPEVIRAAVENPVAGLTLSDTLEKNRKEIIYNIKRDITAGLLNGDRMSSMARRIKDSIEQNYKKAVGIARTEVHRVREAGHHDAATELDGVMQQGTTSLRMVKTWKTMKDSRVRKTNKANHRKMDGVTVGMDEEFDLGHGVKAKAPGQSGKAHHDCNCRCYLSYDLKEVQVKVSGKTPNYLTVDEFKEMSTKANDISQMVASEFKKDTGHDIGEFAELRDGSWSLKREYRYEEVEKFGIEVKRTEEGKLFFIDDYVDYYNKKAYEKFDGVYSQGYGKVHYVQSADGSHAINTYLRLDKDQSKFKKANRYYTDDVGVKEINESIKKLDKLIEGNVLPKDMALDRWAGENFVTDCLKIDTKSMQLETPAYGGLKRIGHAYVSNVDVDKLAEEINKKLIGSKLSDKGFLSASAVEEKNVFIGSTVRIKIQAPKGTHAFVTNNVDESEVILGRNTELEIVGATVGEKDVTDDWSGTTYHTRFVEVLVRVVE